MIKTRIVKLIREDPRSHGVLTEPKETSRKVYGTVKSIGQQEAYQAMGAGLNPALKVVLAHDFEYKGEDLCEMGGIRYRIMRTYLTETDGIELTLEKESGNARPLPAEQKGVGTGAN